MQEDLDILAVWDRAAGELQGVASAKPARRSPSAGGSGTNSLARKAASIAKIKAALLAQWAVGGEESVRVIAKLTGLNPNTCQKYLKDIKRRHGDPHAVARALVFLLESDYINTLTADTALKSKTNL